MTAHVYGEPEADDWKWNGTESATVTLACTNSGCSHTEEAAAEITDEVTKAATCYEKGVRTYTATVKVGEKPYTATKTEEIAMTEHVYGKPTWTWTEYESAKATFACTNDGCTHTEEVTADITSNVTQEATCYEKGEKEYTATVTFGEKPYTDTKTEELAKKPPARKTAKKCTPPPSSSATRRSRIPRPKRSRRTGITP